MQCVNLENCDLLRGLAHRIFDSSVYCKPFDRFGLGSGFGVLLDSDLFGVRSPLFWMDNRLIDYPEAARMRKANVKFVICETGRQWASVPVWGLCTQAAVVDVGVFLMPSNKGLKGYRFDSSNINTGITCWRQRAL